ncbi:MAG: aspartate aminotransferase family protein [Gemmatimonadota bacterium]
MVDEPPGRGDAFARLAEDVVASLREHMEACADPEADAIRLAPLEDVTAALGVRELLREGGLGPGHPFLRAYLEGATRLHSPNCMAHQVAATLYPSAVADLIAGFTNNATSIYEMGPTAVAVELAVVDWMIEKVGWNRPSVGAAGDGRVDPGGVLTHGGSLANLTALLAARAVAAPEAWKEGVPQNLAILAPASAHFSLSRAAGIMGLGTDGIYLLPADPWERVLPDQIHRVHARAVADGKRVAALCANACATATGLYDPLEECGLWCRENDVWFHVDGAHGASALISQKERHRMRGADLADSLVWDTHKMLHTSALCAAVLVRDVRTLTAAFRQDADYVLHERADPPGPDLLPRTVECTKPAIGLKLALNLAVYGEAGLARRVESLYERTRSLARVIRTHASFDVPFEPQSNILCFRYRPGDDNAQERLRERLLADGRYYVSSATLGGRRYLRLTIMSARTTDDTVRGLLERIEALAQLPGGSLAGPPRSSSPGRIP